MQLPRPRRAVLWHGALAARSCGPDALTLLVRRVAGLLAAGVSLILVLVAIASVAAWSTLPPRHARLRVVGLMAPVSVVLDRDGVPRITATNDVDAAAALGYLHARDRMFQMELMRRAVSGRLSEIAGPATLPLDRLMRTLGLARLAAADLAGLPPDTRRLLDAYAAGVNAWISERGRRAAPEFLLLGRPAPWQPADSLLWGRLMGLSLSNNWQTEMSRAALAGAVPLARLLELWPARADIRPADATASLDLQGRWQPVISRLAAALEPAVPRFPAPFTLPDEASDAWAVDGTRSRTGAPLLAGDPHLAFSFPAIWYLARIDTPTTTLAGATAPGVPFLVIGRNRSIAWSFTTAPADTQDVFVETVLPDGARYATPHGPRAFASRVETIAVRGGKPVSLTVRETRHGPVISDLSPFAKSAPSGRVLAVSMTSLLPGDASTGLLALNRARTVDEAGLAAGLIVAPVQNLLVADRSRIALFTTGQVPRRAAGVGRTMVDGADGRHDWVGLASGPALPRIVAPASGELLNGNERSWPADFPVFMGADGPADWRAQRIRALLAARLRHDVADFAAMQVDSVSAYAADVLPALRRAAPDDGSPASWVASTLAGWSGRMSDDAAAPTVFNAWTGRFYALLLERQHIPARDGGIPEDLTGWLLGPAPTDARQAWCGDADCRALLRQALDRAGDDLAERFGRDPSKWRWGRLHQAIFAHPLLGALPLLGPLTTTRVSIPGDDTTLFRGGDPQPNRFAALHGAAYRGVYDLADLDRSRFIVVPGQSGNPLSAHAYDMVQRWADGDTISLGSAGTLSAPAATVELVP